MSLLRFLKTRSAKRRAKDEAIHAAALEEFNSGARRNGLWAKAIIGGMGDLGKTEATYLRLLVEALATEQDLAQPQHPHARTDLDELSDFANQNPNWYYTRDGKQLGPVYQYQLAELVGAGTIGPDEQVFGPGLITWRKVKDTKFGRGQI